MTLLTISEVAERLKCSSKTIRRMIIADEIPYIKLRPRIIRIEELALKRFMIYQRLRARMALGQEIYDADDIAQILDISDWHVHKAIFDGELKAESDGSRHLVVKLSDLLIWLADWVEKQKENGNG